MLRSPRRIIELLLNTVKAVAVEVNVRGPWVRMVGEEHSGKGGIIIRIAER
jgi:hypothetical protein